MQNASISAPPAPPHVTPAQLSQSPTALYRAAVAQRKELRSQQEALQDTRGQLSERLQEASGGADRAGIERRIADIDQRIASVDAQLAEANAAVARAASVPGAVVPDPPIVQTGPPEEAYVLGGLFMLIAILPLSIAYARRIWRRSSAAVSALPQELMERITRLDHAVDSIAVEVERIGEGQRFVTRLFAERTSADPLPAARSSQSLLEDRGGR